MATYVAGTTATLTSTWQLFPDGPLIDPSGITITITAVSTSVVAVGPTSSGVVHVSTGADSYAWAIPSNQAADSYLVTWSGTYSGSTITATEIIQVQAAPSTIYASLAELKTALRIPTSDTADDTELNSKLASASRRVDKDTGRPHGFALDTTTSQRIYRPHHEELLSVDDIGSTTGLLVEIGRGTTWSGVDSSLWDTLPENSIVDGRAIETIRRLVGQWPMWGLQRIRVTAQWGWPSIPDDIKNATILLASRLFRRKDSPEGIKGFGDLGVVRVSRYDSDYDNLIDAFIRDAP